MPEEWEDLFGGFQSGDLSASRISDETGNRVFVRIKMRDAVIDLPLSVARELGNALCGMT